jgi:hypothetical protein
VEGLVVMPRSTFLRRSVVAAAALAAALAGSPALAWGELGHRVVADLAYQRLTPETRAHVDALIAEAAVSGEPSCPVASFADAAAFPDCVDGIRRYNELRRLHYEERPFCPPERPRDVCKDGECVTGAVKRAAAVLADPAAPPAAKLYALEQAAHFMADLHQPMNLIDNRDDRGEDIRVVLPGSSDRKLNLNRFWNEIVLAPALGSEEDGARYVAPLAQERWAQGDVDGWAIETHALARTIYERLPEPPECGREPRDPEMLDRGYVMAAVGVAREQLAKSAVRLAALLNANLR